jgi:predicted RNA-binding Zn ribbon-like protein
MDSERVQSPLVGEPLAVDLANTLEIYEAGDTVDFLLSTSGLSDWLGLESGRLEGWAPVTKGELSETRALRAAIRELLEALVSGSVPSEPPEDGVRRINAASAGAPTHPELACSGARLRVRTRGDGAASSASSLAAVARSAIEIAGGHVRGALRVCEATGCPRLFLATRPQRRWCSEVCGNRARVARHYRRYRASR